MGAEGSEGKKTKTNKWKILLSSHWHIVFFATDLKLYPSQKC